MIFLHLPPSPFLLKHGYTMAKIVLVNVFYKCNFLFFKALNLSVIFALV